MKILIKATRCSIVNEAIKTSSNSFKKNFYNTENTNQVKINKIKQASIKQQKQQFFVHKNFIRGGKSIK